MVDTDTAGTVLIIFIIGIVVGLLVVFIRYLLKWSGCSDQCIRAFEYIFEMAVNKALPGTKAIADRTEALFESQPTIPPIQLQEIKKSTEEKTKLS